MYLSLPPSRALEGYFLMWPPIAYGEWQHAYAPPCTSPYLSQWAPAPWPCLDMDYPRIPHPNSYKPKLNCLPSFCHLPEESDSFLLSGKVICLHINLFCIHLFMVWLGLTYPEGTIEHTTDLYPQAFQPIHRSQQKIGWKQMFYGRFSNQWTHLLRATRPDLDPTKLITKTIVIVWQHLLEVWTARQNFSAYERRTPY